jgi:Ca2+-binding RTX toxin-like protein
MTARLQHQFVALVLAVLALASTSTALAASSTVPGSNASTIVQPTGANDLKPASCASLTLTTVVIGTNGTSAADLLLGSAGIDVMNGAADDDCILGGGGSDIITGGTGTDVCIGGPGIDTFTGCETSIQ